MDHPAFEDLKLRLDIVFLHLPCPITDIGEGINVHSFVKIGRAHIQRGTLDPGFVDRDRSFLKGKIGNAAG